MKKLGNITFIYCPRSGDNVLEISPSFGIRIFKHYNGCRHVVGGVLLEFPSADSDRGYYWRQVATNEAYNLIDSVGGVTWDENGDIKMIVPTKAAWSVMETMESIRAVAMFFNRLPSCYEQADKDNRMRCILAGAGEYHPRTKVAHTMGDDPSCGRTCIYPEASRSPLDIGWSSASINARSLLNGTSVLIELEKEYGDEVYYARFSMPIAWALGHGGDKDIREAVEKAGIEMPEATEENMENED